MNKFFSLTILCIAILFGCSKEAELIHTAEINNNQAFSKSYQSINKEQLIEHVKVLASDKFGGRAPSTQGEVLTLDYLTKQFQALGFKPGNGDSYFQEVPLVSIEADPNMLLTIGDREYQYGTDMVMNSSHIVENIGIKDSPLVFVGYGINAPEYQWNDYEGLDVKGKTVIILVNDPGYISKKQTHFTGEAMTYYGRWTYKYEEASRQGAEGAIIIHETAPASYDWSVVRNSWSGPQFGFQREDLNKDRVNVEGWISTNVAAQLFATVGLDFNAEKQKAAKSAYHVELGNLTASININNTIKKSISNNFIATLPGSSTPDEHVIYTAHWDHLGTDLSLIGDQIYNGAIDNATGTAALIEIAEAFSMLSVKPQRSITIMAVTAEEQGLLGSQFYAANPIFPADKTVADINMDALGVDGRSKDVSVYGLGQSQLDDYLRKAINKQGRVISGDPNPTAGIYYRSDHLSFANIGVPALYAKSGKEPLDEVTARLRKQIKESLEKCYHNLCDEYNTQWDLSGAVEDLQAFFEVGYELSKDDVWPQWSETSEFKR